MNKRYENGLGKNVILYCYIQHEKGEPFCEFDGIQFCDSWYIENGSKSGFALFYFFLILYYFFFFFLIPFHYTT
jgi:hypothetical protein